MQKPKTYFIDIDGCLFEHHGKGAVKQWFFTPCRRAPGVHEFFDRLEKGGHKIILVTARKESCRRRLERLLENEGIFYDQLIMGVTSGERVIINDAKPEGVSCSSIEVPRNGGLKCLLESS